MTCRVGMTTDLAARKAYQKGKHPGMRNWVVKARDLTRAQAQAKEKAIADSCNCVAHGGGANPDTRSARWAVYHFEYQNYGKEFYFSLGKRTLNQNGYPASAFCAPELARNKVMPLGVSRRDYGGD